MKIEFIEFFSLREVPILLRGEDFEKIKSNHFSILVEMREGPVDGEEEVTDTDQDVVPERTHYWTVAVSEEVLPSQHQELRQIED